MYGRIVLLAPFRRVERGPRGRVSERRVFRDGFSSRALGEGCSNGRPFRTVQEARRSGGGAVPARPKGALTPREGQLPDAVCPEERAREKDGAEVFWLSLFLGKGFPEKGRKGVKTVCEEKAEKCKYSAFRTLYERAALSFRARAARHRSGGLRELHDAAGHPRDGGFRHQ